MIVFSYLEILFLKNTSKGRISSLCMRPLYNPLSCEVLKHFIQ